MSMRCRRWALAVLVLWATVLTSRSSAAAPGVCLALGDSLAVGIGSTLPRERSAAALLCDWVGAYLGERVVLVDLAVPGERTASFRQGGQLQRLREQIRQAQEAQRPVRFVLLSLGGNDLLALLGEPESQREAVFESFRTTYAETVREIRAAVGDVPFLVLTLYDPTEGEESAVGTESWWVARFDGVIREQASVVGASVVAVDELFQGHIAEWTWWPVDIHPTNAGYEAIARAAWRALGLDREAPVVTLERPSSDAVVDRRYLTVRARVVDRGGIEAVSLWVDGERIGTLDPLPEGDEWITLWETPWPRPGAPLELEVRATDRAGNEGRVSIRLKRAGG